MRSSPDPRSRRFTLLPAGVLALLGAGPLGAQSLLERTPNLTGAWVGNPGTLYFNFLHRFTRASPPTRKVTSSPTFLVAAGLPARTLVGFNYATNSDVAPGIPNEWELFGRVAPLQQHEGAIADVALQGGWNFAARSTDAELSVGRRVSALQLRAAARLLSNAHDLGDARTALGGGALLRLGRWAGVAGDYAAMLDAPDGFDPAWSAALHLAIPYTPHTVSLHVTNTSTATLQGTSAARGDGRRYGFEFTIPVTLRRYFPRGMTPVARRDTLPATRPEVTQVQPDDPPSTSMATPAPASEVARDTAVSAAPDTAVAVQDTSAGARDTTAAAAAPPPVRAAPAPPRRRRPAPRTVQAAMRQLAFTPARIEIAAGGTVTWTNRDAMVHTVTDSAGRFDSGLLEPGRSWSRRFDRPGTYTIHCTPHPFMKAVVVVRTGEP